MTVRSGDTFMADDRRDDHILVVRFNDGGEMILGVDHLDDEGVAALTNVLLYHVTDGRVGFWDLKRSRHLTMLKGGTTRIRFWRYRAFINKSRIKFGLPASNGYLYVIDKVLIPEANL